MSKFGQVCCLLLVILLIAAPVGAAEWVEEPEPKLREVFDTQNGTIDLFLWEDETWKLSMGLGDGHYYSSVHLDWEATLTIQRDCLVTVAGPLVAEGKVNNYGTIVILGENGHLSSHDVFNNYGTIIIQNEGFSNKGEGELINHGTIRIANELENTTGLTNFFYEDMNGQHGARLVNNGTIYVENTKGVGINNNSGAEIINNGTIQRRSRAVINGVISGNGVVLVQ